MNTIKIRSDGTTVGTKVTQILKDGRELELTPSRLIIDFDAKEEFVKAEMDFYVGHHGQTAKGYAKVSEIIFQEN